VNSPFQGKLGEEVVESCHDFPNRGTIFRLKVLCSLLIQSCHGARNRDTILNFSANPI